MNDLRHRDDCPCQCISATALADHDRQVAASTLREAADYAETTVDGLISPDELRGRANAAEREPNDALPLDPKPWYERPTGDRFSISGWGFVFAPREGYEQDRSKYPGDGTEPSHSSTGGES